MPEGPLRAVCLGSLNPVKAAGVRRAYEAFYGPVEVRQVEVSGLPRQPVGLDETVRLACVRAGAASCGGDRVGVEAGVFRAGRRWFVVNAACVRRGARKYVGLSPSFYIPPWLARMALASELDKALERVTGVGDLGSGQGAIGVMSGGVVVREDLVYWATLMALAAAEGSGRLRGPSSGPRRQP